MLPFKKKDLFLSVCTHVNAGGHEVQKKAGTGVTSELPKRVLRT